MKIREAVPSGLLSSGEGDRRLHQVLSSLVHLSQSMLQTSQHIYLLTRIFDSASFLGCISLSLLHSLLHPTCRLNSILQPEKVLFLGTKYHGKHTKHSWPLFPLSRKSISWLLLRVSLNLCLVFHFGFLSHITLCLNPCLECLVPMFEMLSPYPLFILEQDSPFSQTSHCH